MLGEFLRGAIAMGMAVAGLFFLRFWRESRDRLFGFFALSFFLLALNRVLLVLLHEENETSMVPYFVRLLAFGIILAAIADKNFRRTES
jgi:hypothetical protein